MKKLIFLLRAFIISALIFSHLLLYSNNRKIEKVNLFYPRAISSSTFEKDSLLQKQKHIALEIKLDKKENTQELSLNNK